MAGNNISNDKLAQLASIRHDLAKVMIADRDKLNQRITRLIHNARLNQFNDKEFDQLVHRYQRSSGRFEARRQLCPHPDLKNDLPIHQHRDEIIKAVQQHQVVIIAGETGSGKTTQFPQMCLSMGRGVAGLIAHTQPRRIAASSVANRIAQELKSELGKLVGYKVRFTGNVSHTAYIKLMTDGVMLAELQSDPRLLHYDTIIIDEAHERNLNIDFLLGYLKLLLPKRPDLKLIITSATIDTEKFSKHFGNAPVIEVSGRTFPVEVRYRPLDESGNDNDQDKTLHSAILEAIRELDKSDGRGDVLVFLSGERDIREVNNYLSKNLRNTNTEILPLYSRLSHKDQIKVFQASTQRRIVLATNVAETSLTVPGIRYVIDTGTARINRYNYKNKVQRLPIEKISQSNANQRKGRCGRLSDGVCIRLYSEQDFLERPHYIEPEIKRVSLAAVILRMKTLKLGHIGDFPFVDAPDERYIRDGYKLLNELSALDHHHHLTSIGKQLAKMPIDPKLARMILEAEHCGALKQILIICSALSIQDPRERSRENMQAIDEKHGEFNDEKSDFMFYINLWEKYQELSRHLSNNKIRQWCMNYFLSFQRMKEWNDIHQQLTEITRDLGMRNNDNTPGYSEIHRSILSGLLANIALKKEKTEYTGARNITLHLFPASNLSKQPPQWIMAAELIETDRLYASTVAKIEPEWLETAAAHLTKHHYMDPHWDPGSGRVLACDKITLFGLPVNPSKQVNYEMVAPLESREIFIRSALVTLDLTSKARYYQHNKQLINEIRVLEDKQRKKGILISEDRLFQLYDDIVAPDITNSQQFERWIVKQEKANPAILCFDKQQLLDETALSSLSNQPDHLVINNIEIKLEYTFDIDAQHDGITAVIPQILVQQLPEFSFEWLVPGFLTEKVAAIIKSLPKQWRRNFVPAPEFAKACVAAMTPYQTPLLSTLAATLKKMTGIEIPAELWERIELPGYLQMNFKITDHTGKELAQGRDLSKLKMALANQPNKTKIDPFIVQQGCRQWEFGDLPQQQDITVQGYTLTVYPALVDAGDSVTLQLFEQSNEADKHHKAGLIKLFQITQAKKLNYVEKNLLNINESCLLLQKVMSCNELKQDLLQQIINNAFINGDANIRTEHAFVERVTLANQHILEASNKLSQLLFKIAQQYQTISRKLSSSLPLSAMTALPDIHSQLDALIFPGFVRMTSPQQLIHVVRYLDGILQRLDKMLLAPHKDQLRWQQIKPWWDKYQILKQNPSYITKHEKELDQYHWLLEEFRISLFAQDLGTATSVSIPRLTEYVKQNFPVEAS